MAIVANIVVAGQGLVAYKANLRPITCVIDRGVYTTHELGVVFHRHAMPQPNPTGSSSAPTGPQRWPL